MANSPSKAVLIAGAVMAVGAMVMLNAMSQKMTPKSEEEQEQEQQQQQSQAQQKAPPPPQSGKAPHGPQKMMLTQGPDAADSGKASALVALGEDKTVGTSASGPDINIRYSWTPAVQSDPKKVYDSVAAVKSAVPNARIHVINTDETPGTPNGIFVGNKQIVPAAPDGSITANRSVVQAAMGDAK